MTNYAICKKKHLLLFRRYNLAKGYTECFTTSICHALAKKVEASLRRWKCTPLNSFYDYHLDSRALRELASTIVSPAPILSLLLPVRASINTFPSAANLRGLPYHHHQQKKTTS
jgi:hypothetical protein